jgi:hypothetical protein
VNGYEIGERTVETIQGCIDQDGGKVGMPGLVVGLVARETVQLLARLAVVVDEFLKPLVVHRARPSEDRAR